MKKEIYEPGPGYDPKTDAPYTRPRPAADAPHVDAEALDALEGEVITKDQPGPGAAPEPELKHEEVVFMVLSPALAIFAPNWNVTNGEVEQLSKAYGALLDKYFPGGMNFGPELGAAMVTLAVIGPRLGRPAKVKPKQEGDGNEKPEQRAPG